MSDILNSDHLQKILEAAEKVPHGPWVFYKGNNDTDSRSSVQNSEGTVVDDGSAFREYDPEADDATLYYISLLDRDTVTAMVKRLQELEKRCVIALPSKDLA